jgi:hypothetical protein
MRSSRPNYIVPLVLIGAGILLLLNNFLLLKSEALTRFAPVLLVLVGLQLLLRGDLGLTWQSYTFGITRGNVQTASLEAVSGELDIKVRALRREGRLIAGQYTGRSRPTLALRGEHAHITMQRGQTWPFSLADWEVGLARDLPWTLLVSTHLGEIDVDLRGLYIDEAHVAAGLGDVRVTLSDVMPEGDSYGVRVCATMGNITLVVPQQVEAVIVVRSKVTGHLNIDETRFLMIEPGIYATLGYQRSATPAAVELSTTFGTVRLV